MKSGASTDEYLLALQLVNELQGFFVLGLNTSCGHDCIVRIKGVTTRPILFSQLMRSDGEGVMNPEELFADDLNPAFE